MVCVRLTFLSSLNAREDDQGKSRGLWEKTLRNDTFMYSPEGLQK